MLRALWDILLEVLKTFGITVAWTLVVAFLVIALLPALTRC